MPKPSKLKTRKVHVTLLTADRTNKHFQGVLDLTNKRVLGTLAFDARVSTKPAEAKMFEDAVANAFGDREAFVFATVVLTKS